MTDMEVPASDGRQLESLVRGFAIARMLRSVADLAVADRIPPTESVPVNILAADCHVNPDALLRICRALAAFGIFTLADDKIGHSQLSVLLRDDTPGSLHLSARFWTATGNWGA
jgi:hypothetical protein